MFVFLGVSFAALCFVYYLMYRHALAKRDELKLDAFEVYQTETWAIMWLGSFGLGVVAVVVALLLEGVWTPMAGFTYWLLALWLPLARRYRLRGRPTHGRT